MDANKRGEYKVFFIASNLSSLDNEIKYSLSNANGMKNLTQVLKINEKYNSKNFTTYVFSFDFIRGENENDKDINSNRYKAKIILQKNNTIFESFEGIILFKDNKNNFIYDFKLNGINDWTKKIPPPECINYSKKKQLEKFNEALKALKVKQDHQLYKDLIIDSQCYITGQQTFFLDFYLQIFKSCYSQKEVKTLLMMFKLPRVKKPQNMEIKEFASILNLIEKKPDMLIRHCSEKDNKEKYFKYFYTLLLYFRMNYEGGKVNDLLINKNLNKYFIEILPLNYNYFSKLVLPDELIFEILEQNNLSCKVIIGALSYAGSVEKVLFIINKYCEKISNCCVKENNKIYLSEIVNDKKTDNLNEIINEIKKILNYQ